MFYRHFDKHGYDGVDATFSDIESFITAKVEEARVYCACGDMLEKDWLGFGGRVCAPCETVALATAQHQWIERVREWIVDHNLEDHNRLLDSLNTLLDNMEKDV